MKTATIACIATIAAISPLFAQSVYERELKQLTDQRDKALSAAAQPINRNYQASLEQLLRRATQANDLAATGQIVETLKQLTPPSPATRTTPGGATDRGARIEKLLPGSTWFYDRSREHFTFSKGGRVVPEEKKRTGRYRIDPQSAFVSFEWDKNEYPGEGISLDEVINTFQHNRGGNLAPVAKSVK